jgi:hypothetical protein
MAPAKSTHTTAASQSIHLLTSILRLRILPPVFYPLIASIIVSTISAQVSQLYHSLGTQQRFSADWLIDYLEEACNLSAHFADGVWREALDVEEQSVVAVLDCVLQGCGFDVASEGEVREAVLQAKWKREGDWRAGSEPLKMADVEAGLGWIGKEREERMVDSALGEEEELEVIVNAHLEDSRRRAWVNESFDRYASQLCQIEQSKALGGSHRLVYTPRYFVEKSEPEHETGWLSFSMPML